MLIDASSGGYKQSQYSVLHFNSDSSLNFSMKDTSQENRINSESTSRYTSPSYFLLEAGGFKGEYQSDFRLDLKLDNQWEASSPYEIEMKFSNDWTIIEESKDGLDKTMLIVIITSGSFVFLVIAGILAMVIKSKLKKERNEMPNSQKQESISVSLVNPEERPMESKEQIESQCVDDANPYHEVSAIV